MIDSIYREPISNTPFGNFRSKKTLPLYATETSRLIAFLLRDKGTHYSLDLPASTVALINKINNIPPQSTTQTYMEVIHDFLLNLWMTDWVTGVCYSPISAPRPPATSLPSSGDPLPLASVKANLPINPTIHCMILRSVRPDGWAKSRMLTNPLAKLTFAIRAVILRQAHREAVQTEGGGFDIQPALDRFKRWYSEKMDHSTFHDIRFTQHIISAFAFAQKPLELPHIVWTSPVEGSDLPSTGTFRGQEIWVQDIALLAQSIISEAYLTLKEDVLLGLDLRADYSAIADDLSNTKLSYYFLADERNASLKAMHSHSLVKGILGNTSLLAEFIVYMDPTKPDEEPIWNHERLKQWYRRYCYLNSLLAILVLFGGGTPCRGTELTCIQYRNTASRRRGLFYADKRLVVTTQYSKTSSLSGQEKTVPHALDALTSDILLQRIIVADGFARMVGFIAYKETPSVSEVLQSYLFVDIDRPFETATLSATLKHFTQQHLKLSPGIGIQGWRHFSIALRRKFCPEFDSLAAFDRVEHTIGGLQAGHNHAMESRVYGSSQWSFIGYSEDTFPQVFKACEKWQAFLGIPAGGKIVPFSSVETLEEFQVALSAVRTTRLRPSSAVRAISLYVIFYFY